MCYSNRQYDNRARKILDLMYARDDIQKQIDVLEAEIKQDMGDTEQVDTGNYKITWQVIRSGRFDSKAFKAAHEKLYTQFLKQAVTRRFTIKEVQ